MSSVTPPAPDWKFRVVQDWFLLVRFTRRYGMALLALVASAVIGWGIAKNLEGKNRPR